MNRERLFSAGVTLFSIIGILLLILFLFSALGYGGPGGGFGPGVGDGDNDGGDGDGTSDGDGVDDGGNTGIAVDGDQDDRDQPGDSPGDLPGFHSLSTTNRTHYSVISYDRYTGKEWRKTTDSVHVEAINESRESNTSMVAQRPVYGAPVRGGPYPGNLLGVNHHVYPGGDVTPSHPLDSGSAVVFNPRASLTATDESNISRFMDIRYTELPDDLPERVVNLSDVITSSSSDRYDAVEDIVVWINTNKNYSLSPIRGVETGLPGELSERYDMEFDAGDNGGFVDEFLFEMNSGHDMHFASATVVLLRAQGIPARYVVGFEEIDGELRRDSMNHWVEVGLGNRSSLTVYPTSFVYRERHRYTDPIQRDGSSSLNTGGFSDEGIEVEFLDDPVPGSTVDVRVTRNGRALGDVYVRLNDRFAHQVGSDYFLDEPPAVTDQSGVASVWVPFDNDVLSVSIAPRNSDLEVLAPLEMYLSHSVDIDGSVYFMEGTGILGGGGSSYIKRVSLPTSAEIDVDTDPIPGTTSDVDVEIEGVPVEVGDVYLDGVPLDLTDETGGFSYRVPYREHELRVERGVVSGSESVEPVLDGDLKVVGEPRPLETVSVSLSVRGEPVERANVSVNNRTVGFTDINGSLNITVPDDVEFNVTARRGELVESVHMDMTHLYRDMELSITGVAFPSSRLAAKVTSHGGGLRNAELTVNNESLGLVGIDGWRGVSVPIDPRVNSLRLEAEAQGYVVSETKEIPVFFRALFMVYPVMGVVLVVFMLIQLALTRGVPTLRGLRRSLRDADEVPGYLMGVILGLIGGLGSYIGVKLRWIREVLASVPGFVESVVYWVSDGLIGLVYRLSGVPGLALGLVWGLIRGLVSAPFIAWRVIRSGFGGGYDAGVSRGDGFDSGRYDNRVYMAWSWIAGRVSSSSNLAPVEIARRAIDIGMPERPVLRLTRVFQEVRYGGVDPSEELESDAVRSAEKSIEGLEE